jgi:hypothetical protein
MAKHTFFLMLSFILLAGGCATGAAGITVDPAGNGASTSMIIAGTDCESGASRYGSTLTIVYVGEKDWVVYTDRGYFDCTPGAEKYFHFVSGTEVVDSRDIRERYRVPGLREMFMKEGR